MTTAAELLRVDGWSDFIGQNHLKERLDVHIEAAIAQNRPLDHVLLVSPPGFGKGHPLDTLILTPTGWTKIGDLAVNDHVVGSNGQSTLVTGVFDRGILDTYEVLFSDGARTVCDGDHLWTVLDSHRRVSTRSTRDLLSRGVNDRRGARRWRVPLVAPIQHKPISLPIEPYLLGVLLGNGHLESTPCIRTNDVEIIDEIQRRTPNLVIHEATYEKSTARGWNVLGIRAALKEVGLYGSRAASKFVPECYLVAGESSRRSLLAGLLDCDGHAKTRKLGARFDTTSSALAGQVTSLVESLGGLTHVYHYDKLGRERDYLVDISLPTNPFLLPRKADAYRSRISTRRIIAITPVGKTEIRCIQVAAKDNLYVTERYVVTHNTTLAALIAKELGDPFSEIPMPVRPAVLASRLRQFPGGVLFCDEIHRLSKMQQEDFLTVLRDGCLQTPQGRRIDVPWLTVVAGTTEPEKITPALYERFQIKPAFDAYLPNEMVQIVESMAARVELECSSETLAGIAEAACGVPRTAGNLVLAARDLMVARKTAKLEDVLQMCRVDSTGLTQAHQDYLDLLRRLGGQAGLESISTMLRLHPTVIREIERVLVDRSLIVYGGRGRELTGTGWGHGQPAGVSPRRPRN